MTLHGLVSAILLLAATHARGMITSAESPNVNSESDARAAHDQLDPSGHWEGVISYHAAAAMQTLTQGVQIDLSRDGKKWAGAVYSPEWGVNHWPLTDIRVSQADTPFRAMQVEFRLKNSPAGTGVFKGVMPGPEIRGMYTWKGQDYACHLSRKRTEAANQPPQSQIPSGPVPYSTEDVLFRSGHVTIGGRITQPQGTGPFPAVLLLYGSGAQSADPEIPGKPGADAWQWVFADQLTRAGIVVMRVDDRGAGASTGDYNQATLSDLADDALAGVELLRSRANVRSEEVGITGFSEGGLVAAIASARSKSIGFLVLLGTPGKSGSAVLLDRAETDLREAMGEEEFQSAEERRRLAERLDIRRRLYDILQSDAATDAVKLQLEQLRARTANKRAFPRAFDAWVSDAVRPIFRSTLRYDPRSDLRKVTVPVLVLFGGRDVKVAARRNLPEIQRALSEAGNADVVAKELAGLNHSFRKADANETRKSVDTIDDALTVFLANWINGKHRH